MRIIQFIASLLAYNLIICMNCPAKDDIPVKLMMEGQIAFFDGIFEQKDESGSNYTVADYCFDVFNTLFEDDEYTKILIGKNFKAANERFSKGIKYAIKICAGSIEFDSEAFTTFSEIGLQINGSKKILYKPLFHDVFDGRYSYIVILSINDQMLAIKMAKIDKEQIPAILDNIAANENKIGPVELNLAKNDQSNQANLSKPDEAIFKEKAKIGLIRSKGNLSKYFIEVCDSEAHGYPDNFIVMEYGGITLNDYIDKIFLGDAKMLNFDKKWEFYERLLEIFSAIKAQELSYCDLKPENILFDPEDIAKVKLIDFESIISSAENCKISTNIFAPLEFFRNEQKYNAFVSLSKELIEGQDVTKKIELLGRMGDRIQSMIDYYAQEIENTEDEDRKEDITFKQDELSVYKDTMDDIKKKINTAETSNQMDKNTQNLITNTLEELFVATDYHPSLLFDKEEYYSGSNNFDTYSLGVLMMEFEFEYMCLSVDNNTESSTQELSFEEKIDVLTSYFDLRDTFDNIKYKDPSVGELIEDEIGTTLERSELIENEIKEATTKLGYSDLLLTYINQNMLANVENRKSLEDIRKDLVEIKGKMDKRKRLI